MARYFIATLADGSKLTRSSERGQYSHAWRVVYPDGQVASGFASRLDLATKAAEDFANGAAGLSLARSYTSKRKPRFATPAFYRHRAETIASHGGAAAWIAEAEARRQGFKVEIVAAVEVAAKAYKAARA